MSEQQRMSQQTASEQTAPDARASWPIRALVAVAEKVPRTRGARRIILSLVALAAAGGAVLLGISGLSLSQGLAPVSGDRASTVRIATIDVLLAEGTSFLQVPACETAADSTVSCAGQTVDGDALTSTSPGNDVGVIEVRVGDRVVYAGPIDDVLGDAADSGKVGAP